MNEYDKLIAFLKDHAPDVILQAKTNLRQAHDIELEDDTQKTSWWDNLKRDPFALFLSSGLLSSVFISAWRIVWSVMTGQPIWFLFFAFASVISETISEAIMVFRFSVASELEEIVQEKPQGKLASARHYAKYFSLLGILRLLSHMIFGRTYSILHYLLIYLIFLGMLFNLDYELHFVGGAEKLKEVAFAMLPVISIGILSHYLGERVKEAKRASELSGDMFTRLWQKERYQRVLDVLQATPKKWAYDALQYAERLESLSAYSDIPVTSNVGNVTHAMGFVQPQFSASHSRVENVGKLENGKLAEQVAQVLDTYPDILTVRGKHQKIATLLNISVGNPTTAILKAIEQGKRGE